MSYIDVYKRQVWAIAVLGVLLIAAGFALQPLRSDFPLALVIGIIPKGYAAADYFPLLPNLGYFMIGSVLGRTVYRSRQSLLPRFPYTAAPVRFLSFCGRHSLWIYMLQMCIRDSLRTAWRIVNRRTDRHLFKL